MRRKFANRILPWKARQGNWGNPSAPVDVINAATNVFERNWAKRDSDLNCFLAMCSCLPQWFDAMSDVVPSLNGWRQRAEVLLHNMVRAEGQEQELADELSESLEYQAEVPLDKHRLLAENDFSKLLNFVVADGQTLHIVFVC